LSESAEEQHKRYSTDKPRALGPPKFRTLVRTPRRRTEPKVQVRCCILVKGQKSWLRDLPVFLWQYVPFVGDSRLPPMVPTFPAYLNFGPDWMRSLPLAKSQASALWSRLLAAFPLSQCHAGLKQVFPSLSIVCSARFLDYRALFSSKSIVILDRNPDLGGHLGAQIT
jgi:hypothetical protein